MCSRMSCVDLLLQHVQYALDTAFDSWMGDLQARELLCTDCYRRATASHERPDVRTTTGGACQAWSCAVCKNLQ